MSDLSDSAKKADTSLTLTRKSAEILLAAVLQSLTENSEDCLLRS